MTEPVDQAPGSSHPTDKPSETELAGGGTTVVVRIGDTVRRPVRSWSASVHILLDRLRAAGFTGAPRFLGIDGRGREILDHLDGHAGNYPLSDEVRGERALSSAGRLLRAYHDATTELAAEDLPGWQFAALHPVEVICHGDFAPYNCVFTGETATGIIDFDGARPGPRAWDLAYALYRFAPLTHSANTDGFGKVDEQARRARLLLDAYGCTRNQRIAAMNTVAVRLQSLVAFMRRSAADGDGNSARHIADGHADLYLRDIDHIKANTATWQEYIAHH
ncbi:aminoglycoside phosphotransferase family protein [Streptomyces cyaneofuscatus]|uniref:Aminoglycoside phosphotransferase family protein n=1 Tax=Streptomyces cyaneofuscatus TaxID=66883 RepID=A0ABZ1EP80_9ACTN|nr:aminoglycoside phosphotransferase family protein [Streptomyces cyaneofuscatus]WSB05850.1 aminoglycoside phosphotransferase family protein [Streptomyces cyaneofuscatus]WSD50616.1 aminoglycoside phosphotransferase family protein [Streptomyces cyaneofuscatus]